MNDAPQTQTTPNAAAHEQCPCREIAETVREFLGVSPAVKEHLNNSRVEFLKAIREMINARIEHLSTQPQKGTRVAVE